MASGEEEGGLGTEPKSDLYVLPAPTSISVRFIGADAASAYDGDTLLLPPDSATPLSHSMIMGEPYPERLVLRGHGAMSSTLQRTGTGTLACISLTECKVLRLENLSVQCEGPVPHLAPLQVAGQGSRLEVAGVRIQDCRSSTNGGAIRSVSAILEVSDSELLRCSSEQGGGAVWVEGGFAEIWDSNFTSCSAASNGGAIALIPAIQQTNEGGLITQAETSPILQLSGCSWTNNTAGRDGGAVYILKARRSVLSSLYFGGNEAQGTELDTGNGGAIAIILSEEAVMLDVTFSNNRAMAGGGALFWDSFPPLVADPGQDADLASFRAMARLNVPVDRDPTDLCDEYADASEPRTEFPVGCVPGTIPPPPAAPEPEPCILGVLVSEAAVCGPSEHGNVAKFGSCVASNTNPSLRLLECRGAVDFGHRVVPCDELMLAPGLTLEVSAELVDCHEQVVKADSSTFGRVEEDFLADGVQLPPWLISPGAQFATQQPLQAVEGVFTSIPLTVILNINQTAFSQFLRADYGQFLLAPEPGGPSEGGGDSGGVPAGEPGGPPGGGGGGQVPDAPAPEVRPPYYQMQVVGRTGSGLAVRGGPVKAKLPTSATFICPVGYTFEVLETSLLTQDSEESRAGRCKLCESGTYSLNPMQSPGLFTRSRPDVLPGCFPCPLSADCGGGSAFQNRTGEWEVEDGAYILKQCPPATRLINRDLGPGGWTGDVREIDHGRQACEACKSTQYFVNPHGGRCVDCPAGATCNGAELQGAGVWVVHPTRNDEYMLDDCPQGTKLVNQPGGAYTSDPAQVDHASQRCQACQDFEYIVNPKGGMCLPCPVGAICVGGSRFEGRDNSRWAISPSNPNQYDLVGCPEGFKMIVSPPEEQQCQACNTGEYILDPNDPNAVCQLCPSAAANQCRGGRPPIFQLKEVKVSFGINGDCVEADTGTMQGVLSGLLDIHRDDMAITEQCAAQSARRAMQSVNVTLSLSEEKANEVLVTMKDQVVFEAALKEAVAATGLDVTLQELPTVSIAVNSRPASEVWTLEGNEFKLKQCPNGTLLVNTTVDLQNCKQCAVDSYTLSDKDGCQEIESLTAGTKSWLCLNRDCHPCPSGDNGAKCLDGHIIVPVIADSIWQDTVLSGNTSANVRQTRVVKRVAGCPAGYTIKRIPSQMAADECLPCPHGTYTRELAQFPVPNQGPDLRTNSPILTCLPCPRGAACEQGASIPLAEPDYWRGQDMTCQVNGSATASRSTLWKHECQHVGDPVELELEATQIYRRLARVYRCPPKACLGTDPNGTGVENLCREGHEGVVCAVCQQGWAMSNGVCAVCDSEVADGRSRRGEWVQKYLVPPFVGLLLLIAWYYFAWRPLLQSESSIETYMMAGCMACSSLPLFSMLTKTVDLFKKLGSAGGKGGGGGGHIQMVFKIIVGFFQILGSTMPVFEVRWPKILSEMVGWTTYLQFNFISMPGTSCMFKDTTYYDKLRMQTLFPAVTIFLLLVPGMYTIVSGMLCHGGWKYHPKHTPVINRFYQSTMIFLFLIYPSVSTNVLRSLNCKDYGSDGRLLYADHRIDCGSATYRKIQIWSLVCIFVYPIGIPLFMYFSMVRAGISRVAKEKQNVARFAALLNLRKQQLSTMTRAAVSNAIGYPGHDHADEFNRRFEYVYGHGVKSLFRVEKSGDDGEGKEPEAPTLRPRDLRKAIARIAQIHEKQIPLSDVAELVKKYDPNHDGLDYDELKTMLTALVRVHVRFTGHEVLDQLSLPQLRSLRMHDWSLPVPDYREDDGEDEEKEDNQEMEDVDEDESKLNESDSEEETGEKEKLVEWVKEKGLELEKSGMLAFQNLKWRDDGLIEEQNAIRRLGFLFLAYKVEVWWFEVLVMVQKLLLSSVLVFLYTGTASQVAIAFFITFAFLLLVLINRPFTNQQLQTLQVYALVTQALNMFFGIMLITAGFQETAGTSTDDSFFPYLLFILNLSVIFVPLIQMIVNSKALYLRLKGLTARLKRMNKSQKEVKAEQELMISLQWSRAGSRQNLSDWLPRLGSRRELNSNGSVRDLSAHTGGKKNTAAAAVSAADRRAPSAGSQRASSPVPIAQVPPLADVRNGVDIGNGVGLEVRRGRSTTSQSSLGAGERDPPAPNVSPTLADGNGTGTGTHLKAPATLAIDDHASASGQAKSRPLSQFQGASKAEAIFVPERELVSALADEPTSAASQNPPAHRWSSGSAPFSLVPPPRSRAWSIEPAEPAPNFVTTGVPGANLTGYASSLHSPTSHLASIVLDRSRGSGPVRTAEAMIDIAPPSYRSDTVATPTDDSTRASGQHQPRQRFVA